MKRSIDDYYLVVEEERTADGYVESRCIFLVPVDAEDALQKYINAVAYADDLADKTWDEDIYTEIIYYKLSDLDVLDADQLNTRAKELIDAVEKAVDEYYEMLDGEVDEDDA